MNLVLELLVKMKPGEKVVYFLRRHWLIFAGNLLLISVVAVIPLGAFFVLNNVWPSLLLGPISRPLIILLTSAYYLVIWLFFITTFIDYYLDAWIVTNDRILNVEQHGLFSRTVSELDLARIQDVTSEVHGVLPSIFKYGFVYIQTAGEKERFVFEQVPKPHEIRKHILELVEKDQRKQAATMHPAQQ
jgi:uncharacterized membrane protein YdbT with pleckstrin-like domain